MAVWLKILLLLVLIPLQFWALKNVIINVKRLIIYKKSTKHPEYYLRKPGSIVFNEKTGKLEETAGDIIFPD